MLKRRVLSALCACCAALLALPDAALALSNDEHRAMLKNSPANAKADAELNQVWKALRAALKKAGLEQQFDGGQKPPNEFSLLASQQAWLSRRDMEAEELRGAGSEADAHAAATRKRVAYLRGLAEELNRFAALPAPAADAPLMRLLKANGGKLYFEACEDEDEAEGSASAGGTSSPASLCAKPGSSPQRLEIDADGSLRSFTAGRPENPMNQFRWKLAADGSLITANWEGSDSHDFTLQGGRYLRWEDAHNIPARWFVLYGENRQPEEGGAEKPAKGAQAKAAMPEAQFIALCGNGTAEQVKKALADGANPNARLNDPDADGTTALIAAAHTGRADTVAALLAAGADKSAQDKRGYDALWWAKNAAQYGVEYGGSRAERTPDPAALAAEHQKVIELLEGGAPKQP
ncbi:MAG: DUF1311 domain-containing protein [Ottowia sp.]|nr:DUF1311 domain-containing protein [Ottowia sp.]